MSKPSSSSLCRVFFELFEGCEVEVVVQDDWLKIGEIGTVDRRDGPYIRLQPKSLWIRWNKLKPLSQS